MCLARRRFFHPLPLILKKIPSKIHFDEISFELFSSSDGIERLVSSKKFRITLFRKNEANFYFYSRTLNEHFQCNVRSWNESLGLDLSRRCIPGIRNVAVMLMFPGNNFISTRSRQDTSAHRWQSVNIRWIKREREMRNRGDNIYAIEAKQMEPHLWHSINKMQTYVNVTRFLGQFQSIYYQDLEFFRDLFIYLSIFFSFVSIISFTMPIYPSSLFMEQV